MRITRPGTHAPGLFWPIFAMTLLFLAPACTMDPNARTTKKITTKLVRSFGDDAKTINVTFSEGTATLSGRVTDRATQELAEEVARSIEGVTDVQNDVDADEPGALENLKNEAADALLEMTVDLSISRKVGSDFARAIEVEAVHTTVALRGIVPDRSRRQLVVDATSAVSGVERVIDLLEVRSTP